MGETTKISWTNASFNAWWGCMKVSAGCSNCYAETTAKHRGKTVWGPTADRMITSENNWKQPRKWNRDAEVEGKVRRVFTASMSDVFEDRRDLDEPRARLFKLIEETPWLQWLILSKRPQLMTTLIPDSWREQWPPNTVAMTSVEDQKRADERIPYLLNVPAPLRALSVEPLLESVSFVGIPANFDYALHHAFDHYNPLSGRHLDQGWEVEGEDDSPRISWCIVGGESGHHARPFQLEWARSLLAECRTAQTPYFFKQTGSVLAKELGLEHKKGEDISELPEDLQVQEFPPVHNPKEVTTWLTR